MRYRRRTVLALVLMVVATASGARARSPQPATVEIGLADESWVLLIDLPGFGIDKRQATADGSRAMLELSHGETSIIASVFLERMPLLGSTAECKGHYWAKARRSPLPKSLIEHFDSESMATVYWLVEQYQGVRIMQRHVNAYLYRDGVCIDIHLSKVGYTPTDDRIFGALLEGVRFSDSRAYRVPVSARRFPIPGHGAVVLAVPDDWLVQLSQPPEGLPPTVRLSSSGGVAFETSITVVWDAEGRPGYNSEKTIASLVEGARRQVAPSAVETKIPVLTLEGDKIKGRYFHATDRAPKPGEFRYLTQGFAALEDLLLIFTILSNDSQGTAAREALAMLAGARKAP